MNIGVGYQIIKDLAVTEANYDKLFRKMNEGMASQGGEGEREPIKFDPYEVRTEPHLLIQQSDSPLCPE